MSDDEHPAQATQSITDAMDMPTVAGKCAFLGGYVDDGEFVCWFGDEYVCRAPTLVPTGNTC